MDQMTSTLSRIQGCNGYLGNKWMPVHVWQLSQEKTIWQYNHNQVPTKPMCHKMALAVAYVTTPLRGCKRTSPRACLTLVPPSMAQSMRCYQRHVPDRDYGILLVNAPG